MALTLGLNKGEPLFIIMSENTRAIRVAIVEVLTPTKFIMSVLGLPVIITEDKAEQILPKVYISAGVGTTTLARVAITAPRDIKVYRESVYREKQKESKCMY